MSDLISREEAIDSLTEIIMNLKNVYGDMGSAVNGARECIKSLPTAEPERKKGVWIDEKLNSYTSRTYCSKCGSSAPFIYKSDDYYGNHAHGETVKTKFCPNCGADMMDKDGYMNLERADYD